MSGFLFDTDELIRLKEALSGTGADFRSLPEADLSAIAIRTKQRLASILESARLRVEQRNSELQTALSPPPESAESGGAGGAYTASSYSVERIHACEAALQNAQATLEQLQRYAASYEDYANAFLSRYGSFHKTYDDAVRRACGTIDTLLNNIEAYQKSGTISFRSVPLTHTAPIHSGAPSRQRAATATGAPAKKNASTEMTEEAKENALRLSKDRCGRGSTLPAELCGQAQPPDAKSPVKYPPVLQFPGEHQHAVLNTEITDDNGKCYFRNGELIRSDMYTLNGYVYKTNDRCEIESFSAKISYTPETRDPAQQSALHGFYSLQRDQAGHLVARIFNGDPGVGNLVVMDYRINLSDYKKMEKHIERLLSQNVRVEFSGRLEYGPEGGNKPTLITCTVKTPFGKTVYAFDNSMSGGLEFSQPEPKFRQLIDETLKDTFGVVSSVRRDYGLNDELLSATATVTYLRNGKNTRKDVCLHE